MTYAVARQMDLVDFLLSLGHRPAKIHNNDYWYCSPLRSESHPSFKINRRLNVWYDHGMGMGGNLVDFGVLYFNCSTDDFLARLAERIPVNFPDPSPASPDISFSSGQVPAIRIVVTRRISLPHLKLYLRSRGIPESVAGNYCREAVFEIYGRSYTAIGFKNDAGGWELRNPFFKGSSSPKAVRFILGRNTDTVSVFEGFFSFLSWKVLQQRAWKRTGNFLIQSNMLVLNSLSFLEKSRTIMENHRSIHLFLDRDEAGRKATRLALGWSEKYRDESGNYQSFKDLNDFLLGQFLIR